MKSQAVVWPAQGLAAIEEIELHEPGSGEVLLEAECTLISPGTERAFLLSLPNAAGRYPARPGYNFVGRVKAVGAGVEGVAVGDRVAASASHAAHALASPGRMVPVPEELDAEAAVFFNMATIALQGMRRAHIELGESVAVVGQGLIGLLALQFCRLQGDCPWWPWTRWSPGWNWPARAARTSLQTPRTKNSWGRSSRDWGAEHGW